MSFTLILLPVFAVLTSAPLAQIALTVVELCVLDEVDLVFWR